MITATVLDVPMTFITDRTLFSPERIDRGTVAMLKEAAFYDADKVLDLGCGYGVAGIYAAKRIGAHRVVMSDINETAVDISRKNAEMNGVCGLKIILSDGFTNIDDADFTVIMSNPPYHTDFKVPKHFIEKGFNRLIIGGRMYMVTKRRDWYKNKLTAVFGGVRVAETDGYFVFCSEKRSAKYASKV